MIVTTSRLRLTAWYLLAFVPILLVFSFFIYREISNSLRGQFDTALLRIAQFTVVSFTDQTELSPSEYGSESSRVFTQRAEAVIARFKADATRYDLRMANIRVAILKDGQLLAATDQEIVKALKQDFIQNAIKTGEKTEYGTDLDLQDRLVAVSRNKNDAIYTVVLAETLKKMLEHLAHLRHLFFLAIPATLAVAGVICYLVTTHTLRAVIAIAAQATRIGANNLGERIRVVSRNDELGRLAETFNELLARLEASFITMREFMADASHELRTPLAIIHGEAEVSLATSDRSADRQALEIIRDQSKRMSGIVNDLLALARADAGERRRKAETLYLNDVMAECCVAAKFLADKKGLELQSACADDVSFCGDEELLKRMMLNLLDNAIRYTPCGGTVRASVAQVDQSAVVVVADTGIGISAQSQRRLFNRFFRVAGGEGEEEGCSGLGLAIVKMAVDSHAGSIDVESEPGQGARFTVRLPLAVAA